MEDTHSYEIVAGLTEGGGSVTLFDAPGEQMHHWHEASAPEGSRIVGDEFGNMVSWNGETGEVVTAMHPDGDRSMYEVSESDLEF